MLPRRPPQQVEAECLGGDRVEDEVELGHAPVDNGRTVTRLRNAKSVIANYVPEGRRRGLGDGRTCDT